MKRPQREGGGSSTLIGIESEQINASNLHWSHHLMMSDFLRRVASGLDVDIFL